nr:DUF904 domain-containing protein [Desulfobacula toluolica]
MGNDLIKKKFDEIDGQIDFMIELCHTLQLENQELLLKIKNFETELDKKKETEDEYLDQQALIHSKIDGLLTKLDDFANSDPEEVSSNL